MTREKNILKLVLLLLIFSPHNAFSGGFNSFAYGDYYVVILPGEKAKLFYGENLSQFQIKGIPRWIYKSTITSNGLVLGNAFNGVNYQGLLILDIQKRNAKIIDLVQLGSPSNFIDKILPMQEDFFLYILGELYRLNVKRHLLKKLDHRFNRNDFFVYANRFYECRKNKIFVFDKSLKKIDEIIIGKCSSCVIKFIDESYIFLKSDEKFSIYSLQKREIVYTHEFFYGNVSIFKLPEYYLIVNNKLQYFFDGKIFAELPLLNLEPLAYNDNNNKLLIRKGETYQLLSVNHVGTISDFNITFINNYYEITPKINRNTDVFVTYNFDQIQNRKFNSIKKIRLNDPKNLGDITFYMMTSPYCFSRGWIKSGKLLKYKDVFNITFIIVIMILLVYLYVLLLKKYFLLPFFFVLPILFLLLSVIANFLGLFLSGLYSNLLMLIIGILVGLIYCLITKENQDNETLLFYRSFAHGSEGLNNLIRLNRLSDVAVVKYNLERDLLQSAINLYLMSTSKSIKNLVHKTKCTHKTFLLLIITDYYQKILSIKLNLFRKKIIKKPKLRPTLLKLLESIEHLKNIVNKSSSSNLNEIVNAVVKIRQEQLFEHNITVVKKYDNNFVVPIGTNDLFKIIDNLLINSVEALAGVTEAKIIIEAGKKNRYCEIIFIDNGFGIKKHHQSRIFELGFSSKDSGRGFGLYEIKRIIEKYSGSIKYEAIPRGSLFMIHLKENL